MVSFLRTLEGAITMAIIKTNLCGAVCLSQVLKKGLDMHHLIQTPGSVLAKSPF
jgi:hypothetical protein